MKLDLSEIEKYRDIAKAKLGTELSLEQASKEGSLLVDLVFYTLGEASRVV